jgi:pimeloyl-ACP methyl ester carboxylesterase
MAKVIFGNHAAVFVPPGLAWPALSQMIRTGKMTMAYTLRIAFAAVLVAASPVAAAGSAAIGTVKNIVLVHGANADGSGWRGVYDILTKDGYHVSVVQQPLTGLADDLAATKRVIDQQDGQVILVGHSYGGTIITVAGSDPKVRALVYVAALQPDVGETTNKLAASMPATVPSSDLKPTKDGFIFIDPTKFAADVAADLPPAQQNTWRTCRCQWRPPHSTRQYRSRRGTANPATGSSPRQIARSIPSLRAGCTSAQELR